MARTSAVVELPKWNAEQSLGLICMAIAASNALSGIDTAAAKRRDKK